jgi:VWFA-related protein
MVQDFTQKPDALIEAAHQLSSHSSPFYVAHGPDQIREDDSLSGADVMKELKMKQGGTAESAKMAAEAIDRAFAERGSQRMDVRVQTTIGAFAQITAAYPGRKRLIWLSGSFPLTLGGDAGSSSGLLRDYGPQIHRLATLLGDSQIAVYAMDVHGLATIGADASTAGADATSSRSAAQASSPFNERQENGINAGHATLSELAEQTGGRAFINRNDIGAAVKEALQDGTAYYDLSYTPTNTFFDGSIGRLSFEPMVQGRQISNIDEATMHFPIPIRDRTCNVEKRFAPRCR